MNETIKTIAFLAVAVVVVLGVWLTRPRLPKPSEESELPKTLFAEFDDPLAAASLEIVKFDESTATLRPFKVARVDEEWSIPSHSNYPADAEDQLAKVAASFIGLEPLDVAGDTPGDHGLFGVVDPDPEKLEMGDTGVGTRVEIKDKNNDPLLSLIIGKQVPDRDELRYVRVPGKDPVYTVKLSTDKLSTKFEDWIEDDLLKLNTWDVKRVQINDYSVDILQGLLDPRSRMTLEYDDGKSEWKLTEDEAFDREKEQWVEMAMAEDEELNTSKLNDMKYALDDLKIVDVRPKPEGLSANLKNTGPLQLDMEAVRSLQNRGFYLNRNQLLSSEGEINVLMKDGVQYVLRFGQIAAGTEEAAESDEQEKKQTEEETEEDKPSGSGVNRYLFVMAEFNEAAIPKPDLQPLPGEAKPEETAEGEKEEEKPEKKEEEEEEEEGGNGAEEETAEPGENAEAAPEKLESGEAEADASEAPAPKADTAEKTPVASAEAEQEARDEEKPRPSDAKTEKDDQKSDTDAERQRIEKENKRKQDEYDEKIKKGQERAQELNDRFADWYYVISDEVYRKIHLGRDDVVKKKEKDEDKDEKTGEDESGEKKDAEPAQPEEVGSGVSDFEKLKEEGLEGAKE